MVEQVVLFGLHAALTAMFRAPEGFRNTVVLCFGRIGAMALAAWCGFGRGWLWRCVTIGANLVCLVYCQACHVVVAATKEALQATVLLARIVEKALGSCCGRRLVRGARVIVTACRGTDLSPCLMVADAAHEV